MKPPSSLPTRPTRSIGRDQLIDLVETALACNEVRFARQSALGWLAQYPGDLQVRFLHARALWVEERYTQSAALLEELSAIDPEFLGVQQWLAKPEALADQTATAKYAALASTLGAQESPPSTLPEWAEDLAQARQAFNAEEYEQAEYLAQKAHTAEPTTALAAVLHLKALESSGKFPPMAVGGIAEHYLAQFPSCLPIRLILANALMQGGEPERAVALLHQTAAEDIAGQVPERLWGSSHPYQSLWPDDLEIPFDLPVPAAVATRMGWNQLPEGEPGAALAADLISALTQEKAGAPPALDTDTLPEAAEYPAPARAESAAVQPSTPPRAVRKSSTHTPEALQSIQDEIERLATQLKQDDLKDVDGRFPVYVVFSTRKGLAQKYGEEGAELVGAEMLHLVERVREGKGWDSALVFGDDPRSTASLGVRPAPADDPWALKLVIRDLDDALRQRGEMIGALLIVGGPGIVPFHHLPNPVDDDDRDVPSDNPYGTRDENYFIPEWPVGRLPGGEGNDPTPLINLLQNIAEAYGEPTEAVPWYERLRRWFLRLIRKEEQSEHPSFGYTAAVWRKASLSVFRPIGEARALLTSPPSIAEHLPWNGMTPARLGYYNLHGLEDTPEWYGQRDPIEPYEGPDYPIALRPEDVKNSGQSPHLVFSEACFGAHIIGKSSEQAMALKFLQAGTVGVIGCTCTAYGSIAPPLIAADLLGNTFWKFLRDGMPAGEALRRAKITLAQEMHRRQGYLDGEDQKTLISFILYGDPLAQPHSARRVQKSIRRTRSAPAEVKTVCDRSVQHPSPTDLEAEVLVHVKRVVEQYLPGMSDAEYHLSAEQPECLGDGHQCPTSQLGPKTRTQDRADRRVVMLSKRVQMNAHVHPRYARLTLDKHGKVVKLAVSR